MHIRPAVIHQFDRRTGARRFVRSGAIGHNRLALGDGIDMLIELVEGNPNRAFDLSRRPLPRPRVADINEYNLLARIHPPLDVFFSYPHRVCHQLPPYFFQALKSLCSAQSWRVAWITLTDTVAHSELLRSHATALNAESPSTRCDRAQAVLASESARTVNRARFSVLKSASHSRARISAAQKIRTTKRTQKNSPTMTAPTKCRIATDMAGTSFFSTAQPDLFQCNVRARP